MDAGLAPVTGFPLVEPDRVAIAGDWHGNTDYACWMVRHAAARKVDTIVHCGDFAFRFHQDFVSALSTELELHRIRLLFVDGNHDDHRFLGSLPVGRDGTRRVAPWIWHLPRGLRWEWHGSTWLALGGGHSVDRQHPARVPGVTWWPEERLTTAQCWKAAAAGPADVMVCHDAPAGVSIPGIEDPHGPQPEGGWPFPHFELVVSHEHRLLLRTVVDAVLPGAVWHGHYHRRYSATLPLTHPVHGERACRVEGLDCDGTDPDRNMVIGPVESLRGPPPAAVGQ